MKKFFTSISNFITLLKKFHAMHICTLSSLLCALALFCFKYNINAIISSCTNTEEAHAMVFGYAIVLMFVFVYAYSSYIIALALEGIILIIFLFTHKHFFIKSKFILYNKFYNLIFIAGLLCFCLFITMYIMYKFFDVDILSIIW